MCCCHVCNSFKFIIDRINNALHKTKLETGYAVLKVFDHAHKWYSC